MTTELSLVPPPIRVRSEDLEALFRAKRLLENPGLAARLANLIGSPVEKGFALLPGNWSGVVHRAARAALWSALTVAVRSLRNKSRRGSSDFKHKLLVGASGGIGGAFGLAALPVELPVSTTLMLRSIADIARAEGHDVRDMSTRLSCLEVFALGGPTRADDATESAYWVVRAALSKAVSEAVTYLGEHGAVRETAPALVRLIATLASRFGVVISEQVAAKAIPLLGAAGGTAINVAFMDHFQNMARGHFIVKRLEKTYGEDLVRETYRSLAVPVK